MGTGPLRILFCGAFGGRTLQTTYYNTDSKLRNGLIRAGYHVLAIDERARARDTAPLGLRRIGIARLQRELLDTARHYRPHLLLFGHTDLVAAETYQRLRDLLPDARFATFFVDPFTTRLETVMRLRQRSEFMDAVFATTGDPAAVAPAVCRPRSAWFMPYPVDAAIETGRADTVDRDALDHDGIFLGSDTGTRADQLAFLGERLPKAYRFYVGGTRRRGDRLTSTTFLETLAMAAACPQLPLDDRVDPPTPRLYTSARIAQTMGQGVLALTPASGAFETIYDDGIVSFGSRAELAERMAELFADDQERRRIAGVGRRLAHERTKASRVARYLVETAMGERLSEDYGWPTAPLQ